MKTNTLKCEEINKEFDSQNPTTIVRGVWNHHSYTVGHATNKIWKSSIWVFLLFEIPQLFNFFNFALSSLLPLFFFIGNINIWVYVLYSIHLLLFLQVAFSSKWMWSDPFPLFGKLNGICSQIFHVGCIWNPFKIFSVSLSAEEFANGTLKVILSKFSVLPLKPFRIPRNTYLFTHDLTRSPLLSMWVTHVKRMRRVRGTFLQNLRANSFSPWL